MDSAGNIIKNLFLSKYFTDMFNIDYIHRLYYSFSHASQQGSFFLFKTMDPVRFQIEEQKQNGT